MYEVNSKETLRRKKYLKMSQELKEIHFITINYDQFFIFMALEKLKTKRKKMTNEVQNIQDI